MNAVAWHFIERRPSTRRTTLPAKVTDRAGHVRLHYYFSLRHEERARIKRGENAAKEKRLGTHAQWSGCLIVPGGMTHKVPDRARSWSDYLSLSKSPARISYPDPAAPRRFLGTRGNVNLITARRFIGTPYIVCVLTLLRKVRHFININPPFQMNSERSR